jgi:hypothetical protein
MLDDRILFGQGQLMLGIVFLSYSRSATKLVAEGQLRDIVELRSTYNIQFFSCTDSLNSKDNSPFSNIGRHWG